MFPYFEMLRPLNCCMVSIAVFIGGFLVLETNSFFNPELWIAMLVAFLITGAGNVSNDYKDYGIDKINHPNRPIPSGRISKRSAAYYFIILFLFGLGLASILNLYAFIIAILNSVLLLLYPFYLKDKLLAGNIVTSYLVGSAFLFGGASAENLELPLLLTLLAILSNIPREIAKDFEDLEGDSKGFLTKLSEKAKTFARRFILRSGRPVLRHEKVLKLVGVLSMVLAISISPLPYSLGILGFAYLPFLILADFVFIYSILVFWTARKKKDYRRASKTIKHGMLLGLLAFIIGSLF